MSFRVQSKPAGVRRKTRVQEVTLPWLRLAQSTTAETAVSGEIAKGSPSSVVAVVFSTASGSVNLGLGLDGCDVGVARS